MIKTELKFWSCTDCISIPSLPLAGQVSLGKVHGSVLHLQDGSDGNCYYSLGLHVHACTRVCLPRFTSVCDIVSIP